MLIFCLFRFSASHSQGPSQPLESTTPNERCQGDKSQPANGASPLDLASHNNSIVMASHVRGTPLPHKTVESFRVAGGAGFGGISSNSTPPSPQTPLRNVAIGSAFGSPSSLRADDEVIVVELGARRIRVGFAGDAMPKAVLDFGPEYSRRGGDWRRWETPVRSRRNRVRDAAEDHELWKLDQRQQDWTLVGERIERMLREAFSR